MVRNLQILILTVLLPLISYTQVLPGEGSVLNFRIIGFTTSKDHYGGSYKLEIAIGAYFSEDSFTRNIVVTQAATNNRIIAEVPSFGTQYTWRITASSTLKGELHHFSTGNTPETDTTKLRLRILKSSKEYKDALFFLDGSRLLYDINGKPVWYLPLKGGKRISAIDLKLTSFGTITYLSDEDAYEINYAGEVVWKAPNNGKVNGESAEHYHHEFTRLTNGHYMVMGSEYVAWGNSTAKNEVPGPDGNDPMPKPKTLFATLIEYDDLGKVVWSWKSSNYFYHSDLVNYVYPDTKGVMDVHENSFYFDEKEKTALLSCKNINRILKIKYPEGTVINSFGDSYPAGKPPVRNSLFCDQHSVRQSSEGLLYFYNNNACNIGKALPTVLVLKEPAGKGPLQKVWEYQCTTKWLDTSKLQSVKMFNTKGAPIPLGQTSGGNVWEMPDKNIFVSMSGPYSKLFIVNHNKKILWCALPEKWNDRTQTWEINGQYRASIVTSRKDFEKLVWNTENAAAAK